MNVTVEAVNPVTRKLSVRIPGDKVKRELDTAYRNLQKEVRMHGFRPGHVPRTVLEARFRAHVENEVATRLISDSLERSFEDNNLMVVSQPNIEPGRLVSGVDFEYVATVEVKPELTAQGYTEIALTREKYPLDEAEVTKKLEALRESKAMLVVIEEDRALEEGDVARLDYTALFDGKPLEKNMPKNAHVAIQPGAFLPGFAEQVIGMKKDETRSFDLTLPADFGQAALAGRTLNFTVTLNDIKRKDLPALDDEFAQDNDAESLEALTAKIRTELQDNLDQISEIKLHREAARKLIEANPVDLPQGLINQQIDLLAQEQRRQQGQKPSKGPIKLSDAEREALGIEAGFRLRASLILESIAQQENLAVTDADVQQRLQDIADETGQRVEAVKGLYMKNNALDDLKSKLLEEKALELVIEKAQISDEERPATDARL